jgi:hypothetical protein
VSDSCINMPPFTKHSSEKYLKKLVGRTDMEDALNKLDKLTQEEARMAVAQNLKMTHTVDDRVKVVVDKVVEVDDRLVTVDNRVQVVDDRMLMSVIESKSSTLGRPESMMELCQSMTRSEWPSLVRDLCLSVVMKL